MSEAVIVALITAAATITAQLILNSRTQAEVRKGQAVFNALADEKLKNVETKFESVNRKLEIHNGYAEKFPRIETKLENLEKGLDEVKAKLK